jgi:prepilin-type N-terminal cleavage/methylation domain-containing protein/prepilin-type processing-associated H-X9-DG protein
MRSQRPIRDHLGFVALRATSKAFTLIELLVVIAIIAILAAILFPVFAQAREKARQISCLSGIKQISTATLMYVQDYDDTFPMNLYLGFTPEPCVFTAWTAIMPYSKNNQLYNCPSNPTAMDFPPMMATIKMPPPCASSPLLKYISYMPNFGLMDWGDPSNMFGANNGRPVKTLAQVEFPAETSTWADSSATLPDAYFGMMDQPVQPRHQNTLNACFVDGHAKNMKAKPWLDDAGKQLGGKQPDGRAILYYKLTDAGPYQDKPELRGIPCKKADGSWGLFGGIPGKPNCQ